MSRRFLLPSALFSVLACGACGGTSTPGDEDLNAPRTFEVRLENRTPYSFVKSGVFDTPVSASAPGPIKAGQAFEVTFTAGKAHRLSFVTMFGQSNDWFFASRPEGIALYEDGAPRRGDVTAEVNLYDAGTEVDQEPAVGPDTGPKQSGPEQGAPDPTAQVRRLGSSVPLTAGGAFAMPQVASVIQVKLTPTGTPSEFKLRITNVSTSNTLNTSGGHKPVGLSPGVFAVHTAPNALFTPGERDRGEGLEQLAESGRTPFLKDAVGARSGRITGFSPGVYAVHGAGAQVFFAEGQRDRSQGLEALAESGNIAPLLESTQALQSAGASRVGSFKVPEGATAPGPILPGHAYVFEVQAAPGERLSFVSMLGASNDWFVSTGAAGLALFDADGVPASGDLSRLLQLDDAGTEADQELGVGPDTGPNQSAPDMGAPDSDADVRPVDASVVDLGKLLTLTVTPQ